MFFSTFIFCFKAEVTPYGVTPYGVTPYGVTPHGVVDNLNLLNITMHVAPKHIFIDFPVILNVLLESY